MTAPAGRPSQHRRGSRWVGQLKEALRWAAKQAELTGATLEAIVAWHYPTFFGSAPANPRELGLSSLAEQALAAAVDEVFGADHPAWLRTPRRRVIGSWGRGGVRAGAGRRPARWPPSATSRRASGRSTAGGSSPCCARCRGWRPSAGRCWSAAASGCAARPRSAARRARGGPGGAGWAARTSRAAAISCSMNGSGRSCAACSTR